jgi:B-box zinc finger/zinc finger of C3HC4-type, RING
MATASSAGTELDDLTECPICADVYIDPRTLPCVHTYCLKCIESWCRGKKAGNQAACPLCRKTFVIPNGGAQCLPKNFIMEKLKHLKLGSVNANKQTPCDSCSSTVGEPSRMQSAKMRCIECQQNLCESCVDMHKKTRATCLHRCVKLDDGDAVSSPSTCDKHKSKNLELYCAQCKVPVCAVCYIESHKSHTCTDIDNAAGEFKALLISNVKAMTVCAEKWRTKLGELEKYKQDFVDCTTKAETEIRGHALQLKQSVERHEQLNLDNLAVVKAQKLEEFSLMINKIERQLALTESLQMYSDDICNKGSSGNIVKDASSLQMRAKELTKWDAIEKQLGGISTMRVTFIPSDVLSKVTGSLVGGIAFDVTGTG